MGAGDGPFLAKAQVALLLAYLPALGVLMLADEWLEGLDVAAPLTALWVCYSLYLTARCVVLDRRRRVDAWMELAVP